MELVTETQLINLGFVKNGIRLKKGNIEIDMKPLFEEIKLYHKQTEVLGYTKPTLNNLLCALIIEQQLLNLEK